MQKKSRSVADGYNLHRMKKTIQEIQRPTWILLSLCGVFFLYISGVIGYAIASFFDSSLTFSMNPLKSIAGLYMVPVMLLMAALAFCAVFYFVVIIRMNRLDYDEEKNMEHSDRGTMGTSRPLGEKELRLDTTLHLSPDALGAEDVILGSLETETGTEEILSNAKNSPLNANHVIIGSSGTRKTSSRIFNDVFQMAKNGHSMVITDPKGEIFEQTYLFLKDQEYRVQVLNLKDFKSSNGWDAIGSIQAHNKDDAEDNAVIFVNTIMLNTEDDAHPNIDFWYKGEKNLLTAVILYVATSPDFTWPPRSIEESPDEYRVPKKSAAAKILKTPEERMQQEYEQYRTMDTVIKIINGGSPVLNEIFGAYAVQQKNGIRSKEFLYSEKFGSKKARMRNETLLNYYRTFAEAAAGSAEVESGFCSGLSTRLNVFNKRTVRNIMSFDEISLDRLSEEKTAIYLIIDDQSDTYYYLSCLFLSMLFQRLIHYIDTHGRTARIPITLVLDEVANIGTIPNLNRKLSIIRSRGINTILCFQNFSQAETRYGEKEANELFGNCDTFQFLGCARSDTDTQERISKMAGVGTAWSKSVRAQKNKIAFFDAKTVHTETITEVDRLVFLPDEVGSLPLDETLIFARGRQVVRAKKFYYKLHPYYPYCSTIAPEHFNPPWLVHAPDDYKYEIEEDYDAKEAAWQAAVRQHREMVRLRPVAETGCVREGDLSYYEEGRWDELNIPNYAIREKRASIYLESVAENLPGEKQSGLPDAVFLDYEELPAYESSASSAVQIARRFGV